MFSESYYGEIRQYFDRQMELLKSRGEELGQRETAQQTPDRSLWRFSRELLEQKLEEIQGTLAGCAEDEREALTFLYSAMPLSDMLDYPAALYLAYARHGVFLWREGPFAGRVPERIFANYVLHHRVHNEDIADTRDFFYRRLRERTAGKSMYDAVLEANNWCGETATYQSTFMRTQNPLTMYGTGIGRCGEGAPFAATALRSIGIPSRSVSTPWWAHCDDNHVWIEAWCDGCWYFLGGGEPEDSLNAGWFKGPARRAMMIGSRWFGRDNPSEQMMGRPDMSVRLNHLRTYADTLELRIKVLDCTGKPLPGAKVDFCLLNYGKFGSIASLVTGEDPEKDDYGTVTLETGYGDLLVCAHGDGLYGERHISMTKLPHEEETQDFRSPGSARPTVEYTVVAESGIEGLKGLDQWREMDFHAPRDIPYDERKTDIQYKAEKERIRLAAESRRRRSAAFYDEAAAQRVLMRFSGEDREELDQILHEARGNMGEIVRFLEWDFAGRVLELVRRYGQEKWKLEALRTLQNNDYWDIRAEVLAECCISASPYAAELPEEVFFQSLLAPCVLFEKPRACREALCAALGESCSEMIRQNPQCLPGILDELMISMPEQEYANLVTSPVGCLTGGMGSRFSKDVLYVQIYRALGIPARIWFMDRTVEYYKEGRFLPLISTEDGGTGESGAATLILRSGKALNVDDWRHYSLSRFREGSFEPLFISRGMKKRSAAGKAEDAQSAGNTGNMGEIPQEKPDLEVELRPGVYRLVTANRLPNGNQFVRIYDFRLEEGQKKQVELSMREISGEALLERRPVEEITLRTSQGEEQKLSALCGEGRSLFLWLELTKEPTEHVLNELWERRESFGKLDAPIYFVVRQNSDYERDQTLKRAREALPQAEVLVDEFTDAYGNFSYQAGRNPGKLPLAVILENGRECVYSDAGYNVGMTDMLLRILE